MEPNPSAQIIRHICDEKQHTKQLKSVISKYMCVIFALSQIINTTQQNTLCWPLGPMYLHRHLMAMIVLNCFFMKIIHQTIQLFFVFWFYRASKWVLCSATSASQRRINNFRCIPIFFSAEFWFSVAYPWSYFFPWFTISPTCLNHSHQPHPLCTSHKRTLSMLDFKSLNVWRHTLIHPFLWDYSKNCIKNQAKTHTLYLEYLSVVQNHANSCLVKHSVQWIILFYQLSNAHWLY